MARIGTVIDGKYEIITEIGRGGMSVVYLAMDRRLRKQWAVKEAKKKPGGNSNIYELTPIAEANLLKSLDHPNIVRIVDIVEQDGFIYIVEDFVEGESLAEEVKKGPSTLESVVQWGTQLCDVLNYLHTRTTPIIYRDMKPANVQLQPDGKTIKLLDFGIAKTYKPQKTSDTTNLGTRGYAAPEQFDAKRQSDARTDVFSLGITLRSLLMGKTPYDAEFYDDIRKQNPAVTDGLIKVIAKATDQNPANRYQTAAEFKQALLHYHDKDAAVIRIRKRKLNSYRALIASAISFILIGAILLPISTLVKNNDYSNYLKTGKYESCIELDASNPDAYESFIVKSSKNDILSITSDSTYSNYKQIKDNTERKKIALCFALKKEVVAEGNVSNGLASAKPYYDDIISISDEGLTIDDETVDISKILNEGDTYRAIAIIKSYYNAIFESEIGKNAEKSATNLDVVINNMSAIRDYIEKNQSNIESIGEEKIGKNDNKKTINNLVAGSTDDVNDLYTYMIKSHCNCIVSSNYKTDFLSEKKKVEEKCFFNGNSLSDQCMMNFKDNT